MQYINFNITFMKAINESMLIKEHEGRFALRKKVYRENVERVEAYVQMANLHNIR